MSIILVDWSSLFKSKHGQTIRTNLVVENLQAYKQKCLNSDVVASVKEIFSVASRKPLKMLEPSNPKILANIATRVEILTYSKYLLLTCPDLEENIMSEEYFKAEMSVRVTFGERIFDLDFSENTHTFLVNLKDLDEMLAC